MPEGSSASDSEGVSGSGISTMSPTPTMPPSLTMVSPSTTMPPSLTMVSPSTTMPPSLTMVSPSTTMPPSPTELPSLTVMSPSPTEPSSPTVSPSPTMPSSPLLGLELWQISLIAVVVVVCISVILVIIVACYKKKRRKKQGADNGRRRQRAQHSVQSVKSLEDHMEITNPSYIRVTAHQTQSEQNNQKHECKAEIKNAATTDHTTSELHSESGNLHGDVDTQAAHCPAEQPSLELGKEEQPVHSVLARRFTFEDGTLLQGVPASEDPEILGEEEEECGLAVKRPPNIYNSQILLIARSPESETGDLPPQDNTSAASRILEPQEEVENLDEDPCYMVSIPMDVAIFHNEDRRLDVKPVPEKPPEPWPEPGLEEHIPTELDKEGTSRSKICSFPEEDIVEIFLSHGSGDLISHSEQQVDTENMYDVPLKVNTKSPTECASGEDVDLSRQFDDPNYMKVTLTNMPRDEVESSVVDTHTHHDSAEKEALQPETENKLPPVAQQHRPKNKFEMRGRRRNIDPLALIDLQEEELADLDPDIAAFLMSSSDNLPEMKISEV